MAIVRPPLARRSRWWRWFVRLLLGLATVGVAGLGLLVLMVRHLDHHAVKRRLQALVRSAVGFEVDYGQTHVQIRSGLRITDVVVLSPPLVRALSPELLRVGSLEVGWSLGPLLRRQALLTRVVLRDVALTVVTAAEGRSAPPASAAPGGKTGQPAKPPTPHSQLVAELLRGAPPFAQATLDRVSLTVLEHEGSQVVQRLHLTGLSLGAVTARAPGGWQLTAWVGAATAPQTLSLQRERAGVAAGEATAALWLSATVSPSQAQAALDLRVLRQTLVPELTLNQLLTLEAQARFERKLGRIDLELGHLRVADGAATLDASLELPDAAGMPPLLRRTRGAVELQPLLAMLGPDRLPVSARRGLLHFDIAALLLASAPRLAAGGHAEIEGDLEAGRLALGDSELLIGQGKISLKAEPTAELGTALRATVPLHGVRYTRLGEHLAGESLQLTAAGHIDHLGAVTGEATVHFGELSRTAGNPGPTQERIAVRGGHLAVHATERVVHAHWTASGQLDGVSVALPQLHAEVDRIGLGAQAQLSGGAPYSLALDLPLTGLRLADGKGRPWYSGPAHLSATAAELYPDRAALRHTRGDLTLALELGTVHAQVAVHKHPGSLDFDLTTEAPSLALVRPLVSAAGFQVPWENLGLSLRSQGKVEQLYSTPQLSQHSELRLDRPAFTSATGAVAAQGLVLVSTTQGTTRHHTGDLDLRVRGLKVSGESLDDVHLTVAGEVDADRPALQVRLLSDAQTGPRAAITARLAFDRAKQALSYDVDGKLAKLMPLQPFLAKLKAARGFDLSALELSLGGRGTVVGLVVASGPGGPLRLAPHPLATLGVNGTLALGAAGLYWGEGDRVVKSPLVDWRSTLSSAGEVRKLHAELQLAGLHVEFGEHELDFVKARDELDLTMTGDLADGEGELAQKLSLGELQQDFASGYALRDLSLALRALRNRDGELKIAELKLNNAGGGTELDLTGHLDLGADRRSLSLHGTLNQELDRLWSEREVYVGHGALALNVGVSSGNLALFHTQAEVKVTDGNVKLPRRGIVVEGFVGEVPLTAEVLLDRRGLHLLHRNVANLYSQLRYADQHPLLSGRSFITVGRIITPLFDVSGLAGNLRIEQNLIALNQFELGLRGGHVTGQCLLDYSEEGSKVQLRVRASHIEASHGERFDGNAAVVLGLADRSVSGRGEILRIGRRHLLDLLDLDDPQHSDPAVNRIRSALALGYPERLSLAFDHGFATARISLGGLAGLVRIDPLRGIPMGPIIDNLLQKGSATEEEP